MADVKFTIRYDISTLSPIPTPRATVTMKVKTDEDGFIPANIRCMDRIILEPMSSTWGDKMGDPVFRIKKMAIESESWPAVQERVEEIILGALAKMQEADARYQKMVAEKPADYMYETTMPGPAPKAAPGTPMTVRFPYNLINLPELPEGWRWSKPQVGEIPETIAFVPGPANLVQTSHNAESLYKVDDTVEEADGEAGGEADEREREEKLLADVDNRHWAQKQFNLLRLPCEEASDFLDAHFGEIGAYAENKYAVTQDSLPPLDWFVAGLEWLGWYYDDGNEGGYPIMDWIEWAHRNKA